MGIRSLSKASISTGTKRSKIWDQSAVVITNSFESIATQTVGAGGAASITFSSIPSTYTHLQLRYVARDTASSAYINNLAGHFNSDNSYLNYYWHYFEGAGTTGGYSAGGVQVSALPTSFGLEASSSVGANTFGAGIVDIFDYANTSRYKTTRYITGSDNNGTGDTSARLGSGLWKSTAAINQITLYPQPTGSFSQYTTFALYGIKG